VFKYFGKTKSIIMALKKRLKEIEAQIKQIDRLKERTNNNLFYKIWLGYTRVRLIKEQEDISIELVNRALKREVPKYK